MHDFFKPWWRKIGVVALAMACLFAAGWVRSNFVADSISWVSGTNACEFFMSAEQNLTWETTYDLDGLVVPTTFPVWSSSALDFTITGDDEEQPAWRWRLFGIESGEITTQMTGDSSHGLFCSVPYWCFVLPLTLLSTYLLLSKPGPPGLKQTTEPAPTTRA